MEINMNIDELRMEIDAVDDEILRLLNRRAKLALSIGEEKIKEKLPLLNPVREAAVLARTTSKNEGPLTDDGVKGVFTLIIETCRGLEASRFRGV
jgi:chorismate mutase